MPRFEANLLLNAAQDDVFEFLIRPVNLPAVMPAEANMKLIDVPEVLTLGSRIEFELGGFGVIQRFVHEVTEFDPPHRFTDRQVQGPLKHFVHEHVVQAATDGQVEMIDRIEFEPPGGLAGFVVTKDRILKSLQSSFDHRHRELKRLLEQS